MSKILKEVYEEMRNLNNKSLAGAMFLGIATGALIGLITLPFTIIRNYIDKKKINLDEEINSLKMDKKNITMEYNEKGVYVVDGKKDGENFYMNQGNGINLARRLR